MSLALVALSLAGAAGLFYGLERWGGPEWRGWAAPGAAAVACGGAGLALNLPSWVTIGAFFGLLFLLHKKARQRLAGEARAVGAVAVPGAGWTLEPMPMPEGNRVAAWSCRDGADPDPVVFVLEYAGEKEEEFVVTLSTRAERFKPGVLVAHRAGGRGPAAAVLAEREAVRELPGQTDRVVFRGLPSDFAFSMLDITTLSLVEELLAPAGPERELYLHVNGPELKVVWPGLPGREDIRALLARAAVVAARLRFLGRQQA